MADDYINDFFLKLKKLKIKNSTKELHNLITTTEAKSRNCLIQFCLSLS
jgi:hypothetical protein